MGQYGQTQSRYLKEANVRSQEPLKVLEKAKNDGRHASPAFSIDDVQQLCSLGSAGGTPCALACPG